MKATGIVRRIDDLGRIVIPKEIRRIAHLREGDAMEIYVEDDYICFKKYDVERDLKADLQNLKSDLYTYLNYEDTQKMDKVSEKIDEILLILKNE